jgi:exopolysaccharide biosynthesis polyprenyl glycosylphosphotransferase
VSSTSEVDRVPQAVSKEPTRDVRTEREAAIHLLIRMTLLRAVRILALLAVDAVAVTTAAALLTIAGLSDPSDWMAVALFAGYSSVMGLAAVGAYRAGDFRRDVSRLTTGVLIGGSGLALLGHFAHQVPLTIWEAGLVSLAVLTVLIPARLVTDRITRRVTLGGYLRRRVVLIGDPDNAAAVMEMFKQTEASKLEVRARLAVGPGDPSADGLVPDLEEILSRSRIDAVVVTQTLDPKLLDFVVELAFSRGVGVEIVPAVAQNLDWSIWPHRFFGGSVLEVRPGRLGIPQMALKRAIDLLLALTILALTWPLLVLISLAIKLDSPGPVLFRQERAGLGGRPFQILKFRTMRMEAERLKDDLGHLNSSGDNRLFKIPRDPRVTRVGRWLRRYSLDELPQLFNILRGQMSFVGPRPFFPGDIPHYESHHLERLAVIPGLTGLWQISGRSGVTEFEQVVELDRAYIRHWSVLLDLKILLKTLPAVLRQDGAY